MKTGARRSLELRAGTKTKSLNMVGEANRRSVEMKGSRRSLNVRGGRRSLEMRAQKGQ